MSSDPMKRFRGVVEGAQALQTEVDGILGAAHKSSPVLIGLGGKLSAGKDTMADYLVSVHGFVKLGVSDQLAKALYTLNPWIGERYDTAGHYVEQIRYREVIDSIGYVEAKRDPEVRRLLQVLGTEVGRDQLGEDIWVNASRLRIMQYLENGTPVVLTSIRYPNESRMIRECGGTLVWVERPGAPVSGSSTGSPAENIGRTVVRAIDEALAASEDFHQHRSEVSVSPSDFDQVVINDGSREQLWARADTLLEDLMAGSGD